MGDTIVVFDNHIIGQTIKKQGDLFFFKFTDRELNVD